MKAFSKVTVAANMAFAVAISFFGCSSDDGSDPSTGGGVSSSSDVAAGGSSSSVGGGSSSSVVGDVSFTDKGNDISKYKTKSIYNQTWMAENLNYAVAGSKCYGEGNKVYIFDAVINAFVDTVALSNAEIQANCDKYGRLYDWATAMDLPSECNTSDCRDQINEPHKGICPDGWHIPVMQEFYTLRDNIGTSCDDSPFLCVGKFLKATSGWDSYMKFIGVVDDEDIYEEISGNGTDTRGFTALPGGSTYDGFFMYAGSWAYWWDASKRSSLTDAHYFHMYSGSDGFVGSDMSKTTLMSIRCIKD